MHYLVCLAIFSAYAQDGKEYLIRTVFFYNVENLFDTINDARTADDVFTPSGRYRWSQERYWAKIDRIVEVISSFGREAGISGPDLIGLCEIENYRVLRDLILHPRLRSMGYESIHFDSPDKRGIDVGLFYKKSCFIPITFHNRRLTLQNEMGEIEYTRDQLVVGGLLDNEEVFLIVNHWPSRRGGERRSSSYRMAASRLTGSIVDSIRRLNPNPRIIIMGDFNDNPVDISVKRLLLRSAIEESEESFELYNPMEDLYKEGIGSLAYRDKWSLFDQFILTKNFLHENEWKYKFWKSGIYQPGFLITSRGRYKGYPFRTYAAGIYHGGYSDHFPVYLILIKAKTN